MPQKPSPRLKKYMIIWLVLVSVSVMFQITLGGYVRLTDSGLSMYDWHVVQGVVPPLSEADWQRTFEAYKQTPEYKKINVGMRLDAYKLIYYREYNHRIVGRLTGLLFVLPLFFLLFTRRLRWAGSKIFLLTGLLYAAQGVLGWYMVKSGLVDAPHVSHFRLAAHLIMAFIILALVFWKLSDLFYGRALFTKIAWKNHHLKGLVALLSLLTLQIMYGAFTAGLKAGYVSNTFPLMFGALFPANLLNETGTLLDNILTNSVTIHFIHRWFAFLFLGFAALVFHFLKYKVGFFKAMLPMLFIVLQILFGIGTIMMNMPTFMALIHQAGAVIIMGFILHFMHGLLRNNS